jgi:hypothetical protein
MTTARFYLYSPSSSFPRPRAILMDSEGRSLHSWSNTTDQPEEAEPPSFLKGWNHVEIASNGEFYAIVPLRSVLKLDRASNLLWRSEVSAHHDLALTRDGDVLTLSEVPRLVDIGFNRRIILDNEICVIDGTSGRVGRRHSIFDILSTDADIGERIRKRAIDRGGIEEMPNLNTRDLRGMLRVLRQLPGSPCDVLHTNTLEILDDHPAGFWSAGQLLVSMRNLDLIAVLDLDLGRVVWSWGEDYLSGQHQPTQMPGGRLLIFDNGVAQGRSRLIELDPQSESITWQYMADPPGLFFSAVAGGSEPLPNGNILVTEAQGGHAFELTRDGEVVWSWRLNAQTSGRSNSRAGIYRMAHVSTAVARRILSE